MSGTEEISDEVLDEGSYYLSKLDLDVQAIAQRFEITPRQVERHRKRFAGRLERGEAVETKTDLAFWRSVKEEAEGNIKVTFVSDKGFHHAWRSDLEKLDSAALMSIFEACKHFINLDPSSRFLEYSPPKNYDPLAMQREVMKAITVVENILLERGKPKKEGGH